MRKVLLNMKEQKKYEVIKKLCEVNGNKQRAAITLGVSIRTINRLIAQYKTNGKQSFSHKNKGRKPKTTIDETIKSRVIELYNQDFYDTNLVHFSELLKEHHQICISAETIRLWLLELNIPSVKAHRQTRRQVVQKLKALKQQVSTKKQKNEIDNQIKQVDYPNLHPRRERSTYMGELIQMDASKHEWFGSDYSYLHAAIDDATGNIVGAYFDKEETLMGYYQTLDQILSNYGIPYKFLTDRRTIFEYKKAPSIKEDTYTQFSFACQRLGIEIQTSSVPQAKGRIERLFQTLQSRLIVELRLHKIDSIEKANQFLPSYLKKFNQQFALQFDNNKSVFILQPNEQEKNLILAINTIRTIDKGHSLRYQNKHYFPINEQGGRVYLMPKTQVRVIQAFDKQLYLSTDDQIYAMKEILTHKSVSPDFDPPVKTKESKKIWIPPMDHPYKRASYQMYLQKQKHRAEYSNQAGA